MMIIMMIIMIIIVIIIRQRDTDPKKHNTVAHHPSTNDLSAPKQQLVPSSQFLRVFLLAVMFLGMEDPFGQFPSAVLAMVLLRFPCTSLVSVHGNSAVLDLEQALLNNISVLATVSS